MLLIRVVALLGVLFALSAQGASARTTDQTLSPGCQAAIQSLRTVFITAHMEDADERLNPPADDPTEDATEVAAYKAAFAGARAACVPQFTKAVTPEATVTTPPTLPPGCLPAAQAWKSYARTLWMQGSRPTAAQLATLSQLGQAVRTACGWPGSWTQASA